MNLTYNYVEVLRHDLATLAHELDHGRHVRVAAASEFLSKTTSEDDDLPLRDLAYEIRSEISAALGCEIGDEDENEDTYGIPAIESFVCLRRVYGKDWARLAFADALAHLGQDPCREPLAVATAVLERAKEEYEIAKEQHIALAA